MGFVKHDAKRIEDEDEYEDDDDLPAGWGSPAQYRLEADCCLPINDLSSLIILLP
jgi:hypothetical protein